MSGVGGLKKLSPSSISYAGTGATGSLRATGVVEFATCDSISIDGVFSSTYTNYVVVFVGSSAGTADILTLRYRASGTDNSSASYNSQYYLMTGNGHSGIRYTSESSARLGESVTYLQSTFSLYISGPALAEPTIFRSLSNSGYNNQGRMFDYGAIHTLSSSYDGFTVFGNDINGKMTVYGFVQ